MALALRATASSAWSYTQMGKSAAKDTCHERMQITWARRACRSFFLWPSEIKRILGHQLAVSPTVQPLMPFCFARSWMIKISMLNHKRNSPSLDVNVCVSAPCLCWEFLLQFGLCGKPEVRAVREWSCLKLVPLFRLELACFGFHNVDLDLKSRGPLELWAK